MAASNKNIPITFKAEHSLIAWLSAQPGVTNWQDYIYISFFPGSTTVGGGGAEWNTVGGQYTPGIGHGTTPGYTFQGSTYNPSPGSPTDLYYCYSLSDLTGPLQSNPITAYNLNSNNQSLAKFSSTAAPLLFLNDFQGGTFYVSIADTINFINTQADGTQNYAAPSVNSTNDPNLNSLYQTIEPFIGKQANGTNNNLADTTFIDWFSFPISLQAYDLNGAAKTGTGTSADGGSGSEIYTTLTTQIGSATGLEYRETPSSFYITPSQQTQPRRVLAPSQVGISTGQDPVYYRLGGYMTQLALNNVDLNVGGYFNGAGAGGETQGITNACARSIYNFHGQVHSNASQAQPLSYADAVSFWGNPANQAQRWDYNNYIELNGTILGYDITGNQLDSSMNVNSGQNIWIRLFWNVNPNQTYPVWSDGPTTSYLNSLSSTNGIFGAKPGYEIYFQQPLAPGPSQGSGAVGDPAPVSRANGANDVFEWMMGDIDLGFLLGYWGGTKSFTGPTGVSQAIGEMPSNNWYKKLGDPGSLSYGNIAPTNSLTINVPQAGPAATANYPVGHEIWPNPAIAIDCTPYDSYSAVLRPPITHAYGNPYSDRLTNPFVNFQPTDTGYLEVTIKKPADDLLIGVVPDAQVWQLYNKSTGDYLSTSNAAERDQLTGHLNTPWQTISRTTSPSEGDATLYRFLHTGSNSHFFTADANEKLKTLQLPDYSYEGTAFKVYSPGLAPAGSVPIYRFLNSANGQHYYAEGNSAKDVLQSNAGLTFEGHAYNLGI